ncbi:MAG TPA: hypothetical protein VF884_15070 [Nitrososphaeraceae archaeon]
MNFFTEISSINKYHGHKKDKSFKEIQYRSREAPFKGIPHYEEIDKKPWSTFSKGSSNIELFPSRPTRGNLRTSEVHFIICNNCSWCASLLNPKGSYSKCPTCQEPNIESILVLEDEKYNLHQIPTHEVEIEFSG